VTYPANPENNPGSSAPRVNKRAEGIAVAGGRPARRLEQGEKLIARHRAFAVEAAAGQPRWRRHLQPQVDAEEVAGKVARGVVDTLGRALLPTLLRAVSAPEVAGHLGPALASIMIYLLMAAILFWRPQGLFPARA